MKSNNHIPPKSAQRFLDWFLRDDLAEEVQGDLDEQFYSKLENASPFKAKLNYWYQVLNYLRPFAISNSTQSNPYTMYKNYFKVGWRNLIGKPSYALINIIGLAIGIASVLLIAFHVKEELSYDQSFSKSERIFRITNENLGENTRHWAATPPQLGPEMQQSLPEVELSTRFQRPYPYQLLSYSPSGDSPRKFEERGGFYADEEVIEMFDLHFIQGNPQTALAEKNSIVLTAEMVEKYFGDENPLGKTIFDNARDLSLKVTGVIERFPFQTHINFDYLISMPTIENYDELGVSFYRRWSGFYTYVLLKDNLALASIKPKLTDFMVSYYMPTGETRAESIAARNLHLQPITDIHLQSKLEKEMSSNSDIAYVYIFSTVAFFILLLATVNFINISTTQSFGRIKEVGLRKVVGASRNQLIHQFLMESFIITILATGLSLILFSLAFPFYENLTSRHFDLIEVVTFSNFFNVLTLMISISILAGIFPALMASKAQPISSFKNKVGSLFSVTKFRNSLIVAQFVISIFMIVSTVIIYGQLNLFHQKELGFDRDQVVAVTLYPEIQKHHEVLTTNLLKNPAIEKLSIASRIPGQRIGTESYRRLSDANEEVHESSARLMYSDDKFISTLKIPLKEGRDFIRSEQKEYILNEAAIKDLGLSNPVGSIIGVGGNTGEVVGVVTDFNFASLHSPVEPLVIQYSSQPGNYLLVKIKAKHIPGTLGFIKENINLVSTGSVFSYEFIDEKLNTLYEAEGRMSVVFKAFTLLTIIISCLGLYSLSAHTAKIRTKEIGIRKVLGASATLISGLMLKNFLKLVLIAFIIASPLVYFAMEQWLQNFNYHIDIQWWVFAFAFLMIMVIAILTISYQSIRAARANPVDSLRSE